MPVPERIASIIFAVISTALVGCVPQHRTSLYTISDQNTPLNQALTAGNRARGAGDLASADAFYEQVISSDPRSLEGWLRLGAVQILEGHFVAATRSYRAAQAVDETNAEAAFALGQLALWEGSPADAIEAIDGGLKSHPSDSQLNYLAWVASARLGRFEAARHYYRTALTHKQRDRFRSYPHSRPQVQVADLGTVGESERFEPPLRTQTNGLIIASIQINHPNRQAAVPGHQAAIQLYRIQLGSERSDNKAQESWEQMREQHPGILQHLSVTIKKADLGPQGVFYRVQAGPIESAKEAGERCAALLEQHAECIVVKSY